MRFIPVCHIFLKLTHFPFYRVTEHKLSNPAPVEQSSVTSVGSVGSVGSVANTGAGVVARRAAGMRGIQHLSSQLTKKPVASKSSKLHSLSKPRGRKLSVNKQINTYNSRHKDYVFFQGFQPGNAEILIEVLTQHFMISPLKILY